jgi:hypothetical protein
MSNPRFYNARLRCGARTLTREALDRSGDAVYTLDKKMPSPEAVSKSQC